LLVLFIFPFYLIILDSAIPPIFDRTMPEEYGNLISQSDYEQILDLAIAFLTTKGSISKISNGTIYMKFDDQEYESRLGFDNLVRKCHKHETHEWSDIINDHFGKYKLNKSALNYIFKDFEFAAQLLRPLVKPQGTIPDNYLKDFVQRTDFEETTTFLVLDFEEKFQFLRHDNITEWETSIEGLFYVAQQNVNREQVEVRQVQWGDMSFYALFSGNFAVSYLLDIEHNIPNAIGSLGTMIAIPTKGVAFAFPIEDMALLIQFIQTITGLITQYYNEDESPITDNYYWYHKGKFHLFPYEVRDQHKIIFPPKVLLQMLKSDDDNDEDDD
jgi:hypothetical protein